MANLKLTPCLWFDKEAEEAANFYVSVFKNSKIDSVDYYPKEGFEIHGMPEGSVLTVSFQLDGNQFTAMNGGPVFKFNEAVSFQIFCDTQQEIDYYWNKLTEEGNEVECGWLKDKYGLSWQVVPTILPELLIDPVRAERVFKALLQMKKLNIEQLTNA